MPPPRTYITDLTHFLDPEGNLVDGPAGKMGHYLALIVEQGSVMDIGQGGLVAIPCSRPSRRKRCGGFLSVGRSAHGSIEWECNRCGEKGVTRNWAGTRFNLSSPISSTPASGDCAETVVLVEELWAVRRLGDPAPDLRRLLVRADDFSAGYVMFRADHGALEALRDAATDAAFDARGSDRRLLDRFAARMDAFRTTLPFFMAPQDTYLNLEAAEEAGTPPEVITLAREVAAHDGRDDVSMDDLIEAGEAYRGGKRTVLH